MNIAERGKKERFTVPWWKVHTNGLQAKFSTKFKWHFRDLLQIGAKIH